MQRNTMSEDICPLAEPGEEFSNPAKCKSPKGQGRPCPHIYYYKNFWDCDLFKDWISKLIPIRKKEA